MTPDQRTSTTASRAARRSVAPVGAQRRPRGRVRWRRASICWPPAAVTARCRQAASAEKIPSPDNPIRWPLSEANPAIDSGLMPERGSTLRVYNYADYLSPRMLKDFEKKYGVDVRLSTFNDADEALTKIASKDLKFDLYFPSYDSLGRLIQADLLRPLNQDYLTNSGQPMAELRATPGTTSARSTPGRTPSTAPGIGWRTDMVPDDIAALENPYDSSGTPQYNGNMAILDDWHTAMAMVLLRNGQLNINSTDPDDIAMVREQLLELRDTMNPQVTISHVHRPARRAVRPGQMWSGRRDQPASTTCPRQDLAGRACATGSPRTARARSTTTWWSSSPKVRTRSPRTSSSTSCSTETIAETQLRLHRLPAAADRVHPGPAGRRRLRPGEPRQRDRTERATSRSASRCSQLPVAADAAYHQIWQEFKAGG